MALEISPIDTFKQIKEINEMLSRRRAPKNEKVEEKKIFSNDDEIELRALILDNTNSNDLLLMTKLVEICKRKGYEEKDIVGIVQKMISERTLETLNNKYVIQVEDSD